MDATAGLLCFIEMGGRAVEQAMSKRMKPIIAQLCQQIRYLSSADDMNNISVRCYVKGHWRNGTTLVTVLYLF